MITDIVKNMIIVIIVISQNQKSPVTRPKTRNHPRGGIDSVIIVDHIAGEKNEVGIQHRKPLKKVAFMSFRFNEMNVRKMKNGDRFFQFLLAADRHFPKPVPARFNDASPK